jgi:antirestriction protein ArdC
MSAYDKVIDELSDKLVTELEQYQSTGKYNRPYRLYMPHNVASTNAYSATNLIVLMFQMRRTAVWGTFNQWAKLGYHPAKNTGVPIYSPPLTKRDVGEDGSEIISARPPRAYHVFNSDDVRNEAGDAYPDELALNTDDENDYASEWFELVGAKTSHDSMRPEYVLTQDVIRMPSFQNFNSSELYYSTFGHELIHWTGHVSRLNRETLTRYHDDVSIRAREELVAEIGATMICAHLGLSYDAIRDDHLEYLTSWLSALKNDKSFLKDAVKQATTAFQYLINAANAK